MTELRNFRLPAAVWLVASSAGAFAHSPALVTVADFSSTAPSEIRTVADKQVPAFEVQATTNPLNSSRAAAFQADLTAPGAGWAGISLPVTPLPGADYLTLDLNSELTSGVFVTLTEEDGARWKTSVRVDPQWRKYRLPLYQFRWFEGPESRRETRPDPAALQTIELWTGNTFQGTNGFAVDNVVLHDELPSIHLRLASPAPGESLPLQQDARIVVEAVETTGGPVVPFSGQLWVDVHRPDEMLVPQVVAMEEGRAEIPFFARDNLALQLSVWEPHSRAELTTAIPVAMSDLRVRFELEGINRRAVVFANEPVRTRLRTSGTAPPPESVHLRLSDHRGQLIFAQNYKAADLVAEKEIRFPAPGLFQLELKALAQPLSALPQADDSLTTSLYFAQVNRTLERYVDLPEGVTTRTVAGQIVLLADLPSTATIVGQDRRSLWVLPKSPSENTLYMSPFGISSGALFHMEPKEISGKGFQRLDWHRRLGSFWGRNDLWWHKIEPWLGRFELDQARQIAEAYRKANIKLLAVLGYGSAWARDGAAPATPQERQNFRRYLTRLLQEIPQNVYGYEVWSEPNTDLWRPAPDARAYRELVKATWDVLRGGETTSPARIVAGATAGYDPVFLRTLMENDYARFFDVISLHPYPEALDRSPEENNLPEILGALRSLMRQFGVVEKERWITEIGWPTMPGGVSGQEQANFLVRTYTLALAHGITKIFWYNLQDEEDRPWIGDFRAHTGLMDSELHPKPAFFAYKLMNFMLGHTRFAQVRQQGRAVVYTFDILPQSVKYQRGRVHVVWVPARDGEMQPVEVPIEGGGPVIAIDYLGAEQEGEQISKTQGKPSPAGECSPAEGEARTAVSEAPPVIGGLTYQIPDPDATYVWRFEASQEPLFIWDVGLPGPKKR